MLISVLILGGMFAAVMGLSLVFLNEIRVARQTGDSVKAVTAADTGIECALYKYFGPGPKTGTVCTSDTTIMTNGATFSATITGGAATTTRAVGTSFGINRAFEADIPL